MFSFHSLTHQMAVLLANGEPFIHGLNDDGVRPNTSPTTDKLAHQQNTDVGTNAAFFELGRGSQYQRGVAVRRGLLFNPGGAGQYTAFAWEAQDNNGNATGRFVQCLDVRAGNTADPLNEWTPAELSLGQAIEAGDYGSNPKLSTFRAAILYLLELYSTETPPVIGGINPASGAVGSIVLINGNNFGVAAGSVILNDLECSIQAWSNYQVAVVIPQGAATGKFRLVTAGGSQDISRDTFTVYAMGLPGPVLALAAKTSAGTATLTWGAPTDTGNLPITDYRVRYRVVGANAYDEYKHSPRSQPNITVGGLNPSQDYEFLVAAVNARGAGPDTPANVSGGDGQPGGSGAFNGARPITRQGQFQGLNVGGTTTAEFLERLFFPATAPAAALQVSNPVRRFGSDTAVTLTYSVQAATNPITGIVVNNQPQAVVQSGGGSLAASTPANTDTTFYVNVTTGSENTSASASVVYRKERFAFTMSTDIMGYSGEELSVIIRGQNGEFATNLNQSRSFSTNDEFIYFFWPDSFGAGSFVQNGLPSTAFVSKTFAFTNAAGFTEIGRLTRTVSAQAGNQSITVN